MTDAARGDSFDAGPGGQITHMHTPDAAYVARLEAALREIGTPEHVPNGFDPLDWWHFKACKRGEIAREALGVTAEDLIRETWETHVG